MKKQGKAATAKKTDRGRKSLAGGSEYALKITYIPLSDIHPDPDNPRVNEGAMAYLKPSMQMFGFLVPMVLDEDHNILAGHTRYKVALELGLKEAPCHVKTGLTREQKEAYRIADNRSGELSLFDFDKVAKEILRLDGFDFTLFGFEPPKVEAPDVEPLSVEQADGTEHAVLCPRCGKVVARK